MTPPTGGATRGQILTLTEDPSFSGNTFSVPHSDVVLEDLKYSICVPSFKNLLRSHYVVGSHIYYKGILTPQTGHVRNRHLLLCALHAQQTRLQRPVGLRKREQKRERQSSGRREPTDRSARRGVGRLEMRRERTLKKDLDSWRFLGIDAF